MTAAKANRRIRKRDRVKGNVVGLAADHTCEFGSEIRADGNPVPSISDGVVHPVDAPGVGHNIKSEIERASPYKFHFRIAQLRIDADHALAQNLRALANSVFAFGKKCGATAKKHAAIGGKPIVIKKVFGVVDHAVFGA